MIKFSQLRLYLMEHKTELGFKKTPSKEGGHDYSHHQHVGEHHVGVHFEHSPDLHDEGWYHHHFTVGGKHSRKETKSIKTIDRMNILHHIHKKVHEFVKTHKPKGIHFTSEDSEHHKRRSPYERFGRDIAEKHGGHYNAEHELDGTTHEIKFPHH